MKAMPTRDALSVASLLVAVTMIVVPCLREWWCIPPLFIIFSSISIHRYQSRFLEKMRGFPCPDSLPVLGHVNYMHGSRLNIFKTVRGLRAKFGSRFLLYILNEFAVNLSDADAVEIMLSCTKNITKGQIYNLLHSWLGNGLLTSTGQHWATHRKLLTPAFHFSILEKLSPRLQHHSQKFAESLEELMKNSSDGAVDLMPQITKTTLAAIVEVAMGVDLKEAGDKYIDAVHSVGYSICNRISRPWLWIEFIHSILPRGRQLKKDLKILHGFSSKVIAERKAFFLSKQTESNFSNDSEEDNVGIRKKLAFLDVMLTAQLNGTNISDEDIRHQVDTFMFEGHDTTAMGIYWTLYLLADHPEIQGRLREEVKSVELKEAAKLPYLDRVIRESLRLYPSVPFISRQIDQPLKLAENQVLIPPMSLHIHLFDLHRDPEHFPDPLKFDPDREYPTHPFAYVPFSGGSRNCIGRRLAILEIKFVVAATLRRLRLGKPPIPHLEVPIPTDLVLRPGIQVKVPLEAL